jgi:hypothetical protein
VASRFDIAVGRRERFTIEPDAAALPVKRRAPMRIRQSRVRSSHLTSAAPRTRR